MQLCNFGPTLLWLYFQLYYNLVSTLPTMQLIVYNMDIFHLEKDLN
jgi:hypothetical protein